jgi:hypothetical protein
MAEFRSSISAINFRRTAHARQVQNSDACKPCSAYRRLPGGRRLLAAKYADSDRAEREEVLEHWLRGHRQVLLQRRHQLFDDKPELHQYRLLSPDPERTSTLEL